MKRYGRSWLEAIGGVVELFVVFLTPFLRSRRQRWGTSNQELETTYPGDDLVSDPKWMATHAITINSTPKQIWPWIAQIGQGRGGFYSYEKLENLAGCKIKNATSILEEHQNIRKGDPFRLHPDMPPMTMAIVDEPSALVMYGNPGATTDNSPALSTTWAFFLIEQPDKTTRLISRTRYHHGDDLSSKLMGGPLLMEPISFIMEKKMLKVIKTLVESQH